MTSNIFEIAGSAMRAQNLRLNTTASNLANANSVAGSEAEAYRARHPVFASMLKGEIGGVTTRGVVESSREIQKRYEPDHPMADDEGYIFDSGTVRQLMLQTLKMGSN